MQGLGYKEILDYLDGEISLEEAVYILKRETRHFAKRQLTWFRRERDVIWVNKPDFQYNEEKILEYMIRNSPGREKNFKGNIEKRRKNQNLCQQKRCTKKWESEKSVFQFGRKD